MSTDVYECGVSSVRSHIYADADVAQLRVVEHVSTDVYECGGSSVRSHIHALRGNASARGRTCEHRCTGVWWEFGEIVYTRWPRRNAQLCLAKDVSTDVYECGGSSVRSHIHVSRGNAQLRVAEHMHAFVCLQQLLFCEYVRMRSLLACVRASLTVCMLHTSTCARICVDMCKLRFGALRLMNDDVCAYVRKAKLLFDCAFKMCVCLCKN